MSSRGIQLIEEEAALELQHINIKLLLRNPEAVDIEAIVPVFHSWIQQQLADELLLDVASYAHVENGPGVLLIGHEADYSLDATDGRLGVRYNRKAPIEGTNEYKLEQATRSTLKALARLEQDSRLGGAIAFDGHNLDFTINDRLLAPNTNATRAAVEPQLRRFLHRLVADTKCSLDYETDPRRLLAARVHFEKEFTTSELLRNIGETESQHAGL